MTEEIGKGEIRAELCDTELDDRVMTEDALVDAIIEDEELREGEVK